MRIAGRERFHFRTSVAMALVAWAFWIPARADAAMGDCGQPVSNGTKPTASDALYILRAAVGTQGNCPLSACDINGSNSITAGDALATLKMAVGQSVAANCPGAAANDWTCDFSDQSVVNFSSFFGANPEQAITGKLRIECGDIGNDDTASCECGVSDIAPIPIPTLGAVACVVPGESCGPGTLDCQGDSPADAVLYASHNVGTCTDNDDCADQCDEYCGNDRRVYSGCEGHCAEETTTEMQCTMDSQCGSGECIGYDNAPNGEICLCQCLDEGDAPGEASLSCNVGVEIFMEAAAPCGDEEGEYSLGKGCMWATTATAGTTIERANNMQDSEITIAPVAGSPLECEDLVESGPSSMRLSVSGAFFNTTLADIGGSIEIECE